MVWPIIRSCLTFGSLHLKDAAGASQRMLWPQVVRTPLEQPWRWRDNSRLVGNSYLIGIIERLPVILTIATNPRLQMETHGAV